MSLHPLIRWIGRRCLRWFYRDVTFVGREHVPSRGPVLLIANHPNDIPDVLAVLLSTDRPVRFVATISAASNAVARATYRGLGVIPVLRVRDVRKMRDAGVDVAAINNSAFTLVTEALRQGDVVAVFPEGGVHAGPTISHFKAGISKMALDCSLGAAIKSLKIVPVGVQYDSPLAPRSDVQVVVGTPIDVDDWLTRGAAGSTRPETRAEATQALALRDDMRLALTSVTRNAPTWEIAHLRDRISAAISAAVHHGDTPVGATVARLQSYCAELAKIETQAASVGDSDLHLDLQSQQNKDTIKTYENQLIASCSFVTQRTELAGGQPYSASDCAAMLSAAGDTVSGFTWPSTPVMIALTPIAAGGWLVHAPLFALIWRNARRSADQTEIVARTFIPGLYLILFGYVAVAVLVALGLLLTATSVWYALLVFALLPTFGDVAVWWRDAVREWQLRIRVQRWSLADRATLVAHAAHIRDAWHLAETGSPQTT